MERASERASERESERGRVRLDALEYRGGLLGVEEEKQVLPHDERHEVDVKPQPPDIVSATFKTVGCNVLAA